VQPAGDFKAAVGPESDEFGPHRISGSLEVDSKFRIDIRNHNPEPSLLPVDFLHMNPYPNLLTHDLPPLAV
jgi:hypothetical protein